MKTDYILTDYFSTRKKINECGITLVDNVANNVNTNNYRLIISPEFMVLDRVINSNLFIVLPKNQVSFLKNEVIMDELNTLNNYIVPHFFKNNMYYISFSHEAITYNSNDDNGNGIYVIPYKIKIKKGA